MRAMAEPESKYVPVEADLANHRAEKKLRLKWDDGHEAKYPFAYLRGHCPCAACQGHFQPNQFHLVPDAALSRVELVGSYDGCLAADHVRGTKIPYRLCNL